MQVEDTEGGRTWRVEGSVDGEQGRQRAERTEGTEGEMGVGICLSSPLRK